MERQNSRRRRLHQTQEHPPSPHQKVPPRRRSSPRPIVTWLLVTCLLLALAYLSRPVLFLQSWIAPLQTPSHHSESTIRPRIELHPEYHVYRLSTTQYLDWRVTSEYRRPDGVLKKIYLINDLFPGPTIEARSGDTLIITVTNAVKEEPIALHWHGLHVSNAMDGAAGVTQCPIAPGGQFVYNITIPTDQSGTFWYHAHTGISRADGLYGGLIVHTPASKPTVRGLMARNRDAQRSGYEKELLLLIGDWYHRPARDVLAWYMAPGNFGNEPVPDSLLINGVGHFDCSMAVPARPLDCIEQQVNSSFLDLDPNTFYRIRVVNTGALAGLTLVFHREKLDLVHVDSVEVERSQQEDVNSVGILFPGQRMDFILRPPLSQGSEPSSIMVQLDQGCFKYPNPALTPDQTFPIHYHTSPLRNNNQVPQPSPQNHINLDQVPSSPSILKHLPPTASQIHLVYTKIQKMARNHNVPFGYFNQTTWKPQQHPPAPLAALPRNEWDANQFSFSTGPDPVWVDLVVNNLDEGPHPFHLHGHHFYILTVQDPNLGWGSYNPFKDPFPPGLEPLSPPSQHSTDDQNESIIQPYDLTRAQLRDTVQIPSRGYAVLRFRADNPGVWLFHCHILWHLATGMAMLIDVQGDPMGHVAHDVSLLSTPGGVCPIS